MENSVIDAVTLGGSVAPLDFSIWALFLRADLVVKVVIVILFLASDLASVVTGAAFVADGGQTAKTGSPSFMPE